MYPFSILLLNCNISIKLDLSVAKFMSMKNYHIPDLNAEKLRNTFGDSPLSMAQKSLVLKHIHAWNDAVKNNYKKILIFEDDAVLNKGFNLHFAEIMQEASKLHDDYLIYLGGADAKVPDTYLLSKEILVALPIATTEAYVTDLVAIKRRLNWLSNNKIILPADHLICSIDKLGKAANYWSRHPIVEQGSVTGIFNSELDNHRRKHSHLFNITRYRWNKFQRHILRRWLAILNSKLN